MVESIIPRVSVVRAVYNGERFVQQAMQSILQQTYNNFELIVVMMVQRMPPLAS
jgi:hypothetical protein